MTENPTDPNHEDTPDEVEETEEKTPNVGVNVEGDADVEVHNGDEKTPRRQDAEKDEDGGDA